MMLSHFATVGALAVRALPVVLLTALVFFNTYVWLMAATISGNRLALAMAFLVTIAAAFVSSATRERVRPMLQSATVPRDEPEKLAGTPFANDARRLRRGTAEEVGAPQRGIRSGRLPAWRRSWWWRW